VQNTLIFQHLLKSLKTTTCIELFEIIVADFQISAKTLASGICNKLRRKNIEHRAATSKLK